MKYIAHWIPAAFCAFLSFLALSSMPTGSDSAWRPAFFCFLPMCFFFVGSVTFGMNREMEKLRQRLADLEMKKPN